jgi:uncharacterized membrane protein
MQQGDSAFERMLGQVLSAGSMISTVLLAIGLALLALAGSAGLAPFALHAGLVVLMATPMMRVLFSLGEYLRRRDWVFVVVTVIVLLELAASVFEALSA